MLPAAFAASSAAPAPVLALPFDAAFAASSIKSSAVLAALLAFEDDEFIFESGCAFFIAALAASISSFVIFPSLKSFFASLYLLYLLTKSSVDDSAADEPEFPFEEAAFAASSAAFAASSAAPAPALVFPFDAAFAASSAAPAPVLALPFDAAFAASSPILLAVLPASSAAFATDDAPEPLLK